MLLDETQAPMDFSRSSELTEFEGRPAEMDHINARKSPSEEDHKGLDLSNSVLDRLSQKVMRCEDHRNCTFLKYLKYFSWTFQHLHSRAPGPGPTYNVNT